MNEVPGARQRVAARDALAATTRRLTNTALTVSALLSGAFAGIAAAAAPGHKLLPGATVQRTGANVTQAVSGRTSAAIPPLPPPPGPGNLRAAPPPGPPAAAPAPAPTQAPPVVVSGGS